MFGTFKTLIVGASRRADEHVTDVFSLELIDQKIREAEAGLKAAKHSLASLIQRQRSESRQVTALETRRNDLLDRAKEAIEKDRGDLANEAAQAVAEMENELELRRNTLTRLETRVLRLQQSVEVANRRIIDLRQGAIQAKAVRREQDIQGRLNRHLGGDSPVDEAQALIANVLNRDDPFEQTEILNEIDRGLSHESLADRMASQGIGPSTKVTAADVLDRLKNS